MASNCKGTMMWIYLFKVGNGEYKTAIIISVKGQLIVVL